MFRTRILVCVLLFVLTGAFGQTVNVGEIDPAEIDLRQVNLSDLELYFYGPVDFYVTGIRYEGMVYSAVLSYDGMNTVSIETPAPVSTDMLPVSIDTSSVSASLAETGIRLENVLVDGRRYSGLLAPTRTPTELLVREAVLEGIVTSPQAAEIDRLRRQIRTREGTIEQLRARVAEQQDEIASLEREVDDPDAEAAALREIIAAGRDELARLEAELAEARTPDWRTALDELTRVRHSGFDNGSAALGSWRQTSSGVSQTDASQRYAKFVLPVNQNAARMLYTLEGQACGDGMRGYGLHFLASDVDRDDLWGYGTSYLVWVTRDPVAYGTGATYVQLYASSSDTRMSLLASRRVSTDIANRNTLQVYTDRANGEVTVLMAGEHVFTFADRNFLRSGSSVALRTLGTAEFRRFELNQ